MSEDQHQYCHPPYEGFHTNSIPALLLGRELRQGEILGLKWEDVGFKAGTLRVCRTLATGKGGPRLSAPKTKGSRRTVGLTQNGVETLRSHLKRQLEEIKEIRRGLTVAGERLHIRLRDR